jgi:hypothetical protein
MVSLATPSLCALDCKMRRLRVLDVSLDMGLGGSGTCSKDSVGTNPRLGFNFRHKVRPLSLWRPPGQSLPSYLKETFTFVR